MSRQRFRPTTTRPTRILSHPAPASEAVELGNGQYFNRPWTIQAVYDACDAGMWFEPTGRHNFADRAARKAAMDHYYRLPRDQFGRILRERFEPKPVIKPFQQGRGRGAI
jgi:hypothetical protein